MKQRLNHVLILAATLAVAACGDSAPLSANGGGGGPAPAGAKRCASYDAERQPLFGDLHVHTTYSLDANTQGTLLTPHEAYRFARGERIGIQPYDASGQALREAQLARPLDFAAVTDHAELFGETEICTNPDYLEYNAPECQFYRERPEDAFIFFNLWAVGFPDASQTPVSGIPGVDQVPLVGADGSIPRMAFCGPDGQTCLEAAKTPWRDIQAAAAAFNDQSDGCEFTTFVGYEWTGAPQSNNLHRNVIFSGAVVPELPVAYQEFPEPELLWAELDRLCTGDCEFLTIPHNSNLSAGLMFRTTDRRGDPYTQAVAADRQRNEPLAEIFQHKGQSECLGTTGAGAQDELCQFELLPYNNLTGDRFGGFNTGPPLEQDFLREALKDGLDQQRQIGANPFKYGFISSTDTHLGTPGLAAEESYPGHGGAGAAATDEVPPGLTDLIENNPGGLAVVWAEENSRESIYAALRRREVYGTTGTRPVVRFFGGWELPANHCGRADYAAAGYAGGVPMGGDLPPPPAAGARPVFSVSALRDPGAAGERAQPLQRIQIIKGWVDAAGNKQEQVIELAGDPNNGATVDTATCATSGDGFASLCGVWEDPEFDPGQHAFYYARVVENPSCRWATYQCAAAGIDCADPDSVPEEWAGCCDARFPKTVQDRAWTSPIWYSPPAS